MAMEDSTGKGLQVCSGVLVSGRLKAKTMAGGVGMEHPWEPLQFIERIPCLPSLPAMTPAQQVERSQRTIWEDREQQTWPILTMGSLNYSPTWCQTGNAAALTQRSTKGFNRMFFITLTGPSQTQSAYFMREVVSSYSFLNLFQLLQCITCG